MSQDRLGPVATSSGLVNAMNRLRIRHRALGAQRAINVRAFGRTQGPGGRQAFDDGRRNNDADLRCERLSSLSRLGALRDAKDEFTARSQQHWGGLLKSMNVPAELDLRVRRWPRVAGSGPGGLAQRSSQIAISVASLIQS